MLSCLERCVGRLRSVRHLTSYAGMPAGREWAHGYAPGTAVRRPAPPAPCDSRPHTGGAGGACPPQPPCHHCPRAWRTLGAPPRYGTAVGRSTGRHRRRVCRVASCGPQAERDHAPFRSCRGSSSRCCAERGGASARRPQSRDSGDRTAVDGHRSALPAACRRTRYREVAPAPRGGSACTPTGMRSEEHTSELQSHLNLVCRLLLEKKKRGTLSELDKFNEEVEATRFAKQ